VPDNHYQITSQYQDSVREKTDKTNQNNCKINNKIQYISCTMLAVDRVIKPLNAYLEQLALE